jgi:hypothetical protein
MTRRSFPVRAFLFGFAAGVLWIALAAVGMALGHFIAFASASSVVLICAVLITASVRAALSAPLSASAAHELAGLIGGFFAVFLPALALVLVVF